MIALVLLTIAFAIALVACVIQLEHLTAQTRDAMNVYEARARHEGRIQGRAQLSHILGTTAHPGWMLRAIINGVGYTVQLGSNGPTMESTKGPVYPSPGIASLLGMHVPARFVASNSEFTLYPISSVRTIFARWLAFMVLAALVAVLAGRSAGERMARETLRPLRALRRALRDIADDERYLALQPMGTDELGELIAAYNGSVDRANKARAERDVAEARTHQFIADAGHQLRTPLTVVSGFVGILRKGQLRQADDGPKILLKMDQQIDIMKNLVEQMMLLESWQSSDLALPELTDVGELVTTVVEPLAASHPQRILRINAEVGLFVRLDPAEFSYAVTNIVANALKYAPDAPVTVDVSADETSVFVSVADEGPGIAPASLPRIFERFYRGSRRDVAGSGLGLAIAKAAVERSHGALSVQSEPGRGARFTITLPRARPSADLP